MEYLLTKLVASIGELRQPNKLIAQAGNQPVAILKRNAVIGYFVPKGAVENIQIEIATENQAISFIKTELSKRNN